MTGPETGSGPDPTERMASVPRPPTAAELGATRAWWVKELGGTDAEAAAEAAEAAKAASPESAAVPTPEPTPRERQSAELEAARAKLGRERTHAATSVRDKEGITHLEHDPTKFDPESRSTTPAERDYWAEMRKGVREGAEELKDNGATTEQIQAFVREGIMAELMQRMQAEVDAKTNPDTIRGQVKAKAVNWIREHRKTRIALGVGLSLGAVAATATGVGGVAIGAIAARAALSGAGAYVGMQDLQEAGGNALKHSEGRHWWQRGRQGKMAAMEQEQVDAMNADQRLQHMTRLLAAKARSGRNPEQVASDDKALTMLVQKEREEIDTRLEDKAETYRGGNLLLGAMKVLDQRVTEQLAAERKQLVDDKKINRRRTFVAGTLAAGLAGYGLVAGVAHDGITLGHHATEAAHHAAAHHGGAHVAGAEHGHNAAHAASHHGGAEAHANAADHTQQVTEAHPSSFANSPEVVTDQIDKGDTPYKVALKHLSRVQGWSHFSPAEQHEKATHFANQLGKVGDHWRYTKEAIKASYNFEPGSLSPDHAAAALHGALPNFDHLTPTGGGVDHVVPHSGAGEHVLPNGGVAAPEAHEFVPAIHGEVHPSSFAHYPEITTQPVRLGDSVTGVAREHLSHIQGWSHFSEAEQHVKTLHLANQLNRVGDHWRYTKEAIQAAFNFKQ